MNAVLLIIIIIGTTAQMVTKKMYAGKVSGGTFTFSWASTACSLLFFLLMTGGAFAFSPAYLGYAAAFAAAYSLTTVTGVYAVKTGPLSLTALFTSYSLIIPTLYGLAFLDEKATVFLVMGVILLLVSIVFVNFEKKGEKKITLRWIVFVFLSFASNGACSVIQRLQQLSADGLYKNEFMVVALLISTAALLLISLLTERRGMAGALKAGAAAYAVYGLANGVVNLLVMALALRLPASLSFPIISCGGIIANTAVSVFAYKEKLSAYQKAGVCMGVVSIILLNL